MYVDAFVQPQAALQGSLDASDDLDHDEFHPHYCPIQLLDSFALLMAGHGRCVRTAMMLGDREYAMWQLACARAMGDAELADVASRLFVYFADTPAAS